MRRFVSAASSKPLCFMQMLRDLKFALNQSETFLQIPDFSDRAAQAIDAAIEQTDQGLCNLASVACGLQADLLSFVTTKVQRQALVGLVKHTQMLFRQRVPQHVARRCLFEAYAEGDLEQVHQAGGLQQHQQLLVSQPMLEMAAAVLATARTAEWQEFEQQHQTITCGTEVIALALPPDVETTQDYVNWLAYDPATGQSRPYEAYLLLSAAVKYGLIKGPILRGSEEVDFIAFGPAFKGMVGGNSQELREHLQAATDAKHFDVMPQQFVANAIKVELKVPIGGDWEGMFAQCKKELDREPELNILLACNFVNCASLADFAEEHRTRLIPWYDDVLDKVAWDASGFWSYDADFHGSPVSADLQ